MKSVCVITGGSSGIGFAAARRMGRQADVLVLAARNPAKLQKAVQALAAEGIQALACPCDIANEASVRALAQFAASCGSVNCVLHIAGMSPHMGDAGAIMAANALGTIYMHNAFYPVLAAGGCLIDTASMSAYMAPALAMPKAAFCAAQSDPALFFKKAMRRVNLLPKAQRPGFAYVVSKRFVIWYAQKEAARFGAKGVRVLSITPGNFETPMGALEAEQGGAYLRFNAIRRNGRPEEIAALYAACASPEMGYLTGADIICDGGCLAGGGSAFAH